MSDSYDDYLTIAQAAAYVGVSAATLRRWDGAGTLSAKERELIALVRDKHLPPVSTTCMHFSKAFTALVALEEGKAVGRQILTPEGA